MNIKKVRIKIDQEDLARRIEKEVNKEVTIKVPIKGIKIEVGEVDDWSWVVGLLIVAALAALVWRLRQDEKTIRLLIDEKNRIEMTPVIVRPTIEQTPTVVLTPTPTVKLRYRR